METTSSKYWEFRLIISLRDNFYLNGDNLPLDLQSSWDLCTFSMGEPTLKAILGHVGVESPFVETATSLQNTSLLSWKPEQDKASWYIIRTERALPDDLILAVSHKVEHNCSTTTAFLHGCTGGEVNNIVQWIKKASDAAKHPALMAVLLAEIQTGRHDNITREYWKINEDMFGQIQRKARYLAKTRLVTRMLRCLTMFRGHMEELRALSKTLEERTPVSLDGAVGQRIQQLAMGYAAREQQGALLKDDASLLLTTLWGLIAQKDSQIAQRASVINERIASYSRAIAIATSQDSSAMKALAVLTMVFLPGTALAAIFDLPTFDWDTHRFWPIAKPSIWIFIVVTVVLTLLVLYIWRLWLLKTIWEKEAAQAQGTVVPYRSLDRLLLRRHDRGKDMGPEEADPFDSSETVPESIEEELGLPSPIIAQAKPQTT
ncbi:uncharacterized protein BDV14DRAFT_188009 [Aspergillus stella-maris]|uniref:uncharacterized protein n=1 Tax=Aspergillus stella-maris TaxID=1810926 RepID=UPI003CCCDE37